MVPPSRPVDGYVTLLVQETLGSGQCSAPYCCCIVKYSLHHWAVIPCQDRRRGRNVSVQEKVERVAFVTGRKDEPERGVQNTKGGSTGISRGHDEEQRWMNEGEAGRQKGNKPRLEKQAGRIGDQAKVRNVSLREG